MTQVLGTAFGALLVLAVLTWMVSDFVLDCKVSEVIFNIFKTKK